MANKNKLSIYLIKEGIQEDCDIIDKHEDSTLIEGVGTLYWDRSSVSIPGWVNSFCLGKVSGDDIFTSNARAVLLVRITVEPMDTKRIFAVTMGYGKYLLKDAVVEERFGLKVTLNTINSNSLRHINRMNIGGNRMLSNEQFPRKAGINDFGFDVERDLVNRLVGESEDEAYISGMITGGDILSLSANVDISNVVDFLERTYQQYTKTRYETNFPWIDQIQHIKDREIIAELDNTIISGINDFAPSVWMAVPEMINWDEIRGFKYKGPEIHDDIEINLVRDSFQKSLIRIDQLKQKSIEAINVVDDNVKYRWSAYKCLHAEFDHTDGNTYCLESGKWYRINRDFVDQINANYQETTPSTIEFDDYTDSHTGEKHYNQSFQQSRAKEFILLDSKIISHGGGYSRVELCDLLSKNNELIHVKRYSGSSTLSHLFNQGTVSAELLVSDDSFLKKANDKIAAITRNSDFIIQDRRDLTVVFAIVHTCTDTLPPIPFFSKIACKHAKQRLHALGLKVEMKGIRDTRKK